MNGYIRSLGSALCVAVALVLCCCSPVDASEISEEEIASYSQGVIEDETDVVSDPDADPVDQTDGGNVYTAESPLYVSLMGETDLEGDGAAATVADDGTDSDYSVSLMADAPITAGDTTGLKAVLLTVLGDYEPILFEYSYGNSSYGREVFQDDVWLCSFWMLMLLTFCVFKMIGGWLTRKR